MTADNGADPPLPDHLQRDFYACPNTGEWVYKFADERIVVVASRGEVARLRAEVDRLRAENEAMRLTIRIVARDPSLTEPSIPEAPDA